MIFFILFFSKKLFRENCQFRFSVFTHFCDLSCNNNLTGSIDVLYFYQHGINSTVNLKKI